MMTFKKYSPQQHKVLVPPTPKAAARQGLVLVISENRPIGRFYISCVFLPFYALARKQKVIFRLFVYLLCYYFR